MADGSWIHGHHFRRQPATHGEPENGERGQLECIDKPAIKIRQVVHALYPVWPLRGPEARMRGGIDVKVLCQSLVKLEPPGISPSAVEHQQRRTLSAVP